MPGGRRHASRAGPPGKSNNLANINGRSNSEGSIGGSTDDKKIDEIYGRKAQAPKHIPIPKIPVDGQLTFETFSFIISITMACLQLLNLYRTVWWLPHSYNDYSMNFYLIDPYLLVFIFTTVARRFIYALLHRLVGTLSPVRWLSAVQRIMRMSLLVTVMSVLCWCLYHMAKRHNTMKIFYLCYPSLIYFLVFGISVEPFFDISMSSSYGKEDHRTKCVIDRPLHNCSLNPLIIRTEVSTLRSDFNQRLKRALFSSSVNAYICGIAPIIFVPPHLHFNVLWVVQYVFLYWLGRINAYFAQAYPVRYCDILHKAALHLGRWIKIDENCNNYPFVEQWHDAVSWSNGSIVKHNREFYRSDGQCTAAEPDNIDHCRFYAFFSNPTMLLCLLMGVQISLVAVQIIILLRTIEWYQVLSMTLLLLINCCTLFKTLRDYLIYWKVYYAELTILEKSQTIVNDRQIAQ